MNYITKIFVVFFLFFSSSVKVSGQEVYTPKNVDSVLGRAKIIELSNPDSACILYKRLCKYYTGIKDLDSYYKMQINIAHCYFITQKNNESSKIYEECIKYFEPQSDSFHLHLIYTGMGGISYNSMNIKQAIYYLELANKFCNPSKYPDLKFGIFLNLANCFAITSQYDSAFKSCDQAKKLLLLLKEPVYLTKLNTRLASINFSTNHYDLAIAYSKSILKNVNATDKRFIVAAYTILGQCYYKEKNYKKSELYLDSALILSKAMNTLKSSAEILQQKINVDTATQNKDKAIKDLLELLTIKDSIYETSQRDLSSDLLTKYQADKKETENKILETENAKRLAIIKWQKVLNYVVVALSLIIIGILFFYLRYRNKQQKRAIEEEKIVAELKALKAQLNPHFIQNIFQIIANQVTINPTEVSFFLQKTSNYFRSVLNGTDKNTQSLEDEILFTEKYLQFQQSLFQNRLTYEIKTDDNIDSFGTTVPTMLLQPFVENSIKYGLQLSNQPIHISMQFKKDDKYLHIIIIDNGVAASYATSTNDKSFGNTLIKKRLNLFYKNSLNQPMLDSKILESNFGFQVSISLPLEKY